MSRKKKENEQPEFDFDTPEDLSADEQKELLTKDEEEQKRLDEEEDKRQEQISADSEQLQIEQENQDASQIEPQHVDSQANQQSGSFRKVVDPETLVGFAGRDENGEGFENTPQTSEPTENQDEPDYIEKKKA